jgi:2-dehydropantoate 2-reductase
MKAGIVGAGAIGGWIAGLLADAGWDVSLYARGATLEALRARGLVIGRAGKEKAYRLAASDKPEALGICDYVIISVKGQSVPEVAPAIAAMLGPETSVVPAINGIPWWFFQVPGIPLSGLALASVDPEGAAAHAIPPERVIGCVVHASAWMREPGVVDVQGEDKLIFGEPDGATSPRCEILAKALATSTVTPLVSPDIRLAIWTKLWGNMSMNPLSVLTGTTTGPMLDDSGVRGLVRAMMLEMQGLGTRIGLKLDMTPDDRMAITRKLGDFKTSMLRDAEAGRAIEIEPILGALVEIADRLSEPAPNLRAVLGLLRVREAGRRKAC